jgi:DNA-binding NtrC family response regulator
LLPKGSCIIKTKIAIIDDNKDFCDVLTELLEKNNFEVSSFFETDDIIKNLKDFTPDLILLDVVMPKNSGIEILKNIKKNLPRIPVIMLSAKEDTKLIVNSMKNGASDYIPKNLDDKELIKTIHQIRDINLITNTKEENMSVEWKILGESNTTKNLINIVKTVSQSDAPVLLQGESGTGKSLCAQVIHKYSKRINKPFITINCSAISPMLIESELFGHQKGSFTGAIRTQKGKFEAAEGGTIFLDEIGVLSHDVQVKILRIIQDKELEMVGSVKTIKVDVRIIAASNQNLEEEVKMGRFREDLYYRLNVLPIHVPPLRERKGDIKTLAEHFLKLSSEKENKRFINLSDEIISLFESYDWPGNIRELDNAIKRAVVMGKEPELKLSDFSLSSTPINHAPKRHTSEKKDQAKLTSLKDLEYSELVNALRESSGNISKAAQILGISRVALYRRMKKHGIGLKN